MEKKEQAIQCFKDGFNCSQAVLSTFASQFGLDKETALRVAGAFGGGMGNLGETCGAVTGALMVIGMKYGKVHVEDNIAKGKTYSTVKYFIDKYIEKQGSIKCKELLGCDLSTGEGLNYAREKDLFNTICPKLVAEAVRILEEEILVK